MNTIPYGRQSIDEEDIEAVTKVLRSDWLTQGPATEKFEKEIAEFCGAKYAVAVSNATAALHLACLASGLKTGDSLWTAANTFVASANCGLYCGGRVDFIDIDPRTYNLSVTELEKKLVGGERPKLLIPVHFAGQSCPMEKIAELANRYNFKVIEDASHAIGGTYKNKPIGSCEFSEMTVFSFHPVKIITSGEGGAITTNNKALFEKLVRLRTHGITRDLKQMKGKSHGPWYYEQVELGFNYRITDIHATLGASQLKKVKKFIERRREIVSLYNREFESLPLTLPYEQADNRSAHHLYVVQLKLEKLKSSHCEIFETLREQGIDVNLHYIPVYLQPYYQGLGFKKGLCPEAENYYSRAISLPLYAGLTETDQKRVISTLKSVLAPTRHERKI